MKSDHVKYLVVWTNRDGRDDFAAFEERKTADKLYEELTAKADTYTAAVCEIVRSTDYGGAE